MAGEVGAGRGEVRVGEGEVGGRGEVRKMGGVHKGQRRCWGKMKEWSTQHEKRSGFTIHLPQQLRS